MSARCSRWGCRNPSWNGCEGEPCSYACIYAKELYRDWSPTERAALPPLAGWEQVFPFTVGISGPTRAGKGTLAKGLIWSLVGDRAVIDVILPSCVKVTAADGNLAVGWICQDSFFHDKSYIRSELGGNNECPAAIKHDELREELQKVRASGDIQLLVVEGFLAFHDERLLNLLDAALWLDVPRDVVHKRRKATSWCGEEHFNDVLWPEHEAYAKRVWSKTSSCRIERINGDQDTVHILQEAQRLVLEKLQLKASQLGPHRAEEEHGDRPMSSAPAVVTPSLLLA